MRGVWLLRTGVSSPSFIEGCDSDGRRRGSDANRLIRNLAAFMGLSLDAVPVSVAVEAVSSSGTLIDDDSSPLLAARD